MKAADKMWTFFISVLQEVTRLILFSIEFLFFFYLDILFIMLK